MSQAYRCNGCGNRTRFDVFERQRSRSFNHYSLGGDLIAVEEQEILEHEVEQVVCRWCGSAASVETVIAEQFEPGAEGQTAGPLA